MPGSWKANERAYCLLGIFNDILEDKDNISSIRAFR